MFMSRAFIILLVWHEEHFLKSFNRDPWVVLKVYGKINDELIT